jgi:4-alpha-glucanotransferase
MRFPRSSGILLHPTSLPGKYGIGDLGEMAYRFVDFLEESGQTLWQVLPLGPTSYGDSPYQSLSAFAGNPNLISFDKLIETGWLDAKDVADLPQGSPYRIDYGTIIGYHDKILTRTYQRFQKVATPADKAAFTAWCEQNAKWLDDFALFAAIKDANELHAWVEWPKELALAQPEALAEASVKYAERIKDHKFRQWLFFTQWIALHSYANSKGIKLVGDIPIFVAHDSSDVWANREAYYLEPDGRPTFVAGVPPDYFSATGQRWGNPLYRWDNKSVYGWWIERFKATLALVDIIRIDHFRGFESYWEVPASEETAVKGRWVKGPGASLFDAVIEALGELPIIAEDLGVMTPEVEALRDKFDLPGMKVLQFGFDNICDPDNVFLPHNYPQNCVAYTGTHDNDTALGWFYSQSDATRICAQDYAGHIFYEPSWDLMRLVSMSVADTVIFPLQDVFGFGNDTRMNLPGSLGGNWQWRFTEEWLDGSYGKRLAAMTRRYGRFPETPKPSTPRLENEATVSA